MIVVVRGWWPGLTTNAGAPSKLRLGGLAATTFSAPPLPRLLRLPNRRHIRQILRPSRSQLIRNQILSRDIPRHHLIVDQALLAPLPRLRKRHPIDLLQNVHRHWRHANP